MPQIWLWLYMCVFLFLRFSVVYSFIYGQKKKRVYFSQNRFFQNLFHISYWEWVDIGNLFAHCNRLYMTSVTLQAPNIRAIFLKRCIISICQTFISAITNFSFMKYWRLKVSNYCILLPWQFYLRLETDTIQWGIISMSKNNSTDFRESYLQQKQNVNNGDGKKIEWHR